MLDTLPGQIGAVAVLVICAFALWKGDRVEQWGGGICFMAWLATILVQDQAFYASDERWLLVGIDILVLLALGWLAWRAERTWPIWATACQAITVAVHLAKFVDFHIPQAAYLAALVLASYGVLIALAVGAWMAWREREALKPL